jgi:uncharacterized protein
MYRNKEGFFFSPSDLSTYLESPFASWMDRWERERKWSQTHGVEEQLPSVRYPDRCAPDEPDEQQKLLQRAGMDHEERVLGDLKADFDDIVEVSQDSEAEAITVQAMEQGAQMIYQARLRHGSLGGWADFVVRIDGQSVWGDYQYEVWDAKLARSAKPYFMIQLCAYAEMMEQLQGKRPEELVVVLGDGERRRFKTNDFFFYYLRLKESFEAMQAGFAASTMPDPSRFGSHGRWSAYANMILEKDDHVCRVANITRSQINKLAKAGIASMEMLATTDQDVVPKLRPDIYQRLKRQALLQHQSIGKEKPCYELVAPDLEPPPRGLASLPPQSKSDVFFDIEGYPLAEGGLEYLLGVVHFDGDKRWWAHDQAEEKASFEAFVDWAHDRWRANPDMHIYHYAPYEVSAMRRLMGKHGTREREIDDLLKNHVFVDLYRVVRQGLIVGTPSYSLKDIERLYMDSREGEVTTSMGSVIAYDRWLDSGHDVGARNEDILNEIEEYNKLDCESLVGLNRWLRARQTEGGVVFASDTEEEGGVEPSKQSPVEEVRKQLIEKAGCTTDAEEEARLRLVSHLLEFHWREAKPIFWRMFARAEMEQHELYDDLDCLGDLHRTDDPPLVIKRSLGYTYDFDPDQDTKLEAGKKCLYAYDLSAGRVILEELDRSKGKATVKLGQKREAPPAVLGLIPYEYVDASEIAGAIRRYADGLLQGKSPSPAVDDLLAHRAPRFRSGGKQLLSQGGDALDLAVGSAEHLDDSVLCIQGPPGAGKTYTAAAVIASLLTKGKRIAVTANSHNAIWNVLHAVSSAVSQQGVDARIVKVGRASAEDLQGGIEHVERSSDAVSALDQAPLVMGATAWVLCRPEMAEGFDYLLVDEAGQFSLANAVGASLCASNLILVGDQMQLAQPIQGSHPGDSGLSALDYLLNGEATIPPDFGIFLDTTYRMHPDVCRFISEAVYEGRLKSHCDNSRQEILWPPEYAGKLPQSGIMVVYVKHEGNTQGSDEEVEIVGQLVDRLVGTHHVDRDGKDSILALEDILLVAPYNMQVRKLERRLQGQARVGSVDRFQGLEAPVVMISMCASSVEDVPRGLEFLMNPNRLNVATSRARSLVILVCSKELSQANCRSVDQMRLLNLFCRAEDCAMVTEAESLPLTP